MRKLSSSFLKLFPAPSRRIPNYYQWCELDTETRRRVLVSCLLELQSSYYVQLYSTYHYQTCHTASLTHPLARSFTHSLARSLAKPACIQTGSLTVGFCQHVCLLHANVPVCLYSSPACLVPIPTLKTCVSRTGIAILYDSGFQIRTCTLCNQTLPLCYLFSFVQLSKFFFQNVIPWPPTALLCCTLYLGRVHDILLAIITTFFFYRIFLIICLSASCSKTNVSFSCER